MHQHREKELVSGILRVHPRGFGFVQIPGKTEGIFIPKNSLDEAVDGDTVAIEISPIVSEKGPEGRVLGVIKRNRSDLVGIITHKIHKQNYSALVPLLGKESYVTVESPAPLHKGDRLLMIVVDWGKKGETIRCKVKKHLGSLEDPSTDGPVALAEQGIRSLFPKKVVTAAKNYGTTVSPKQLQGRENLCAMEIFTIDPDTAKDFDDALSLSQDKSGIYHLGVHIADVSAYVEPGSPLDQEAFLRANSTYLPGCCIPMLPNLLSDNLCSLRPKTRRLTVSVFMDFNAHGEMVHYRICRSVIKSAQRFTYKEAKTILEGKKKSRHAPTLKKMVELCLLLKKQRFNRGSIEFSLPELVVLVDEKGCPTGTDYIEYDITHQLVEEFMLKANETVARHLDLAGTPLPFRIHEEPSEEQMRDFSHLAEAFGFTLVPKPTPQQLQQLFEEALNTPHSRFLATNYIRRMKLAIYSADNIGHFGLALSHYCHFTSPIRRYVDLVAHRLLFPSPDAPSLTVEQLQQITLHCSERERISAKAENSVVLLKKLRFLQAQGTKKAHAALVTRVKPFGIVFELVDLMLEGFLHVSELGKEYYFYQEEEQTLVGRQTKETFVSGTPLWVVPSTIDLATTEVIWRRKKK